MPRFALSLHLAGPFSTHPTHFDLFLEHGSELLTWRLSQPIHIHPYTSSATPIEPHHLKYLDFDGPLSNGRGSVTRLLYGNLLALTIEPHAFQATLSANNRQLQLTIQHSTASEATTEPEATEVSDTSEKPHLWVARLVAVPDSTTVTPD